MIQCLASVCGVAFLVLATCSAQEIRLKGRVLKPDGKPLQYAWVRIQGLELDAFTDTNGVWRISEGSSTAIFPDRLKQNQSQVISWKNGRVEMRSEVDQQVYTKIFSRKGQMLHWKISKIRRGNVSIDPFEGATSVPNGSLLLSVITSQGYRGVIRLEKSGKRVLAKSRFKDILERNAKVADVIRVTDSAYRTTYRRIESYTGKVKTVRMKPAKGKKWYVDARKGTDSGNGSRQMPFKRLSSLKGHVKDGDTVVLYSGQYGEMDNNTIGTFKEWVRIKASKGADVQFDKIGFSGKRIRGWEGVGDQDIYIRFEGVTMNDGLELFGARNVHAVGCKMHMKGDLINSRRNMGKSAVRLRNGSDLLVHDCEITRSAIGVWVSASRNLVVRNSHIHHLSHDALQICGVHTALIEGCDIHNTDDNAHDHERKPWNMHSDGMHIYPIYGGHNPGQWIVDLTFRRNSLYDHECMGVMAQSKTQGQLGRFLFENNIFGPSGGFMFHLWDFTDGLVFRHNSVLNISNRTFKGLYRTLNPRNTFVKLPGFRRRPTKLKIYNNIFVGKPIVSEVDSTFEASNNLYFTAGTKLHCGGNVTTSQMGGSVISKCPYADRDAIDGKLAPGSPAIDAAKPCGLRVDRYGNPRGSKPDIGAVEHL